VVLLWCTVVVFKVVYGGCLLPVQVLFVDFSTGGTTFCDDDTTVFPPPFLCPLETPGGSSRRVDPRSVSGHPTVTVWPIHQSRLDLWPCVHHRELETQLCPCGTTLVNKYYCLP
jgi:hypothetical protein